MQAPSRTGIWRYNSINGTSKHGELNFRITKTTLLIYNSDGAQNGPGRELIGEILADWCDSLVHMEPKNSSTLWELAFIGSGRIWQRNTWCHYGAYMPPAGYSVMTLFWGDPGMPVPGSVAM